MIDKRRQVPKWRITEKLHLRHGHVYPAAGVKVFITRVFIFAAAEQLFLAYHADVVVAFEQKSKSMDLTLRCLFVKFGKIRDIEGEQYPLLLGCVPKLVSVGGSLLSGVFRGGNIISPQA